MVDWIRKKPEVIAYLRSVYTSDRLPNWVGVIEGDVNYSEFLRSKGVELPAMVDDRNSMTVDDYDAKETMEEDIAEGILPVQASTIAATDKRLQTLTDTHGQSRTLTNGNLQNPITEVTAEKPQVMEPKSQTVTEVTVKEVPKKDPSSLNITVKSKSLPVTIKNTKAKLVEVSQARKVMEQRIVSAQPHGPSIVPMEGGGYGKIITNPRAQNLYNPMRMLSTDMLISSDEYYCSGVAVDIGEPSRFEG
jgi:hypothetical protein